MAWKSEECFVRNGGDLLSRSLRKEADGHVKIYWHE